MIYLIPLFLIVIGYIFFDRIGRNKKSKVLWGMIYVTLVTIIGLRYKVGGDTYNYMNYFNWVSDLQDWEPFDISGFEPGFSFITSAIKTYFDDIYVYQTIISALMTFMLMFFINQNTQYKFLSMLFIFVAMYLYFSTEVIRESLAIGGLLMAYPLLRDQKYLSYYAVCFVLLSLHFSSAVCFLLPLFHRLKFNKRFGLYILGFIVFGLISASIMKQLGDFFIFQKLLLYYQQTYVGYAWCGFRFIYFSLLPFLTLYLCKRVFHLKIKFENIICLQILFGIGIWFVPIVFQRLINYTIIFYLVALADIIGTVTRDPSYRRRLSIPARRGRAKIAKILLVLTILAHSSYYIHLDFYERYIPYHSMFDPIDEPMREKYVAGQD